MSFSSHSEVEFSYDALGRRVKKEDSITSANTRRYYYNYNWQILSEFDGSGGYKKSYIYGNYIDEVLMSVGSAIASTHKYYLHDHLSSPVALTDNDGVVVERYEYDVYGKCYIMDASYNPRSASLYGNPFMFTGRELDILDNGSLKIMNYRHRYYDTYTGRFSTHDPLGIIPNQDRNRFNAIKQYRDGLCLYEYGNSDPLLHSDSYGLASNCPGGKWWFAGKILSVHFYVCTAQSGVMKWTCKKRQKIGYFDYECLGGITFEQPVYRQAVAFGKTKVVGVGPGLGVEWVYVSGEMTGTETGEDIAGWSWSALGASVTVICIGGGVIGGGENATCFGGWQFGLGIGLDLICRQRAKLWSTYDDLVLGKLDEGLNQLVKSGSCTRKFKSTTPVWEDVPETEVPWPNWMGGGEMESGEPLFPK